MIKQRIISSVFLGLPFICIGIYMIVVLDKVYFEGWNELFGLMFVLSGIITIIHGLSIGEYVNE